MAKHYHSQFDQRQEMRTTDFEVFYYEDKEYSEVSMHRHDYYEIYFFLEGDLSYQIGKNQYPMNYGDICIIPPGGFHRPQFQTYDKPCSPQTSGLLYPAGQEHHTKRNEGHPEASDSGQTWRNTADFRPEYRTSVVHRSHSSCPS